MTSPTDDHPGSLALAIRELVVRFPTNRRLARAATRFLLHVPLGYDPEALQETVVDQALEEARAKAPPRKVATTAPDHLTIYGVSDMPLAEADMQAAEHAMRVADQRLALASVGLGASRPTVRELLRKARRRETAGFPMEHPRIRFPSNKILPLAEVRRQVIRRAASLNENHAAGTAKSLRISSTRLFTFQNAYRSGAWRRPNRNQGNPAQ